MELVTADLLLILRLVAGATFLTLSIVAVTEVRRLGHRAWWVAVAFGALALVILRAPVFDAMGLESTALFRKVSVLLLLLFPYLMLQFTASFRRLPLWMQLSALLATTAIVVATVALPALPVGGPIPTWALVYVAAALIYWVLLSSVTVVTTWGAGGGQPTLARRRLRLMAAATAVLSLALFLLAANLERQTALVGAMTYAVVLLSALAFGLGFSPPQGLRLLWIQPERKRLWEATMRILRAATTEELAHELLEPTARLIGGDGAAIVDTDGTVVAAWGSAPPAGSPLSAGTGGTHDVAVHTAPLGNGKGDLVVWASPYTAFFGREELGLLPVMGAVAGLALQRSTLLEEERERRFAIEQTQEELERSREEASRANLAKTEFLSRMSHELRTPLNAILGFGQILEFSPLEEDDREAVEHILTAGRHLLALINDVLDLPRIEAGTMAISLEPVQAAELASNAAALTRPMADARSIRLVVDLGGCDLFVRTDRQRCSQVLLNVLSNAVKYNFDGGEVRLGWLLAEEGTVRLTVSDTGPGIEPARQSRLFQPFDRLGAEASAVEGTGLGLAVAKQLIQAMGGDIGVQSAPGRGSTFWIDLPVTEPVRGAEPAARGSSVAPAAGGRSRTLLLVEDNLTNLRLVEAILRRRPEIAVVPVMQGRLAIDLAREHQPDVIVLDLHLPDLSGQEVLHRLRADPLTRHIPVVIASADATPGRIQRLREEGAFEYLAKPLEVQPFLDTVDAALSSSPARHAEGTEEQS
jgi:signal transduction histidine kinase/ActR/RegA family two-component response regulator